MNKTPKSQTPRPQCKESPACIAYQRPCGCGYLDSGTPCGNHNEKRRFTQTQEETEVKP